jgi:hypothetical protein
MANRAAARSLHPPQDLPVPFARHALPRSAFPASEAVAFRPAPTVPARHEYRVRANRFRLDGQASGPGAVNPNSWGDLVALRRTTSWEFPQSFQDGELRFSDTREQVVGNLACRFETEFVRSGCLDSDAQSSQGFEDSKAVHLPSDLDDVPVRGFVKVATAGLQHCYFVVVGGLRRRC